MRITIVSSEGYMRGKEWRDVFFLTSILLLSSSMYILEKNSDDSTLENICCSTNANIGEFHTSIENQITGYRSEGISIPIEYSNNGQSSLGVILTVENLSNDISLQDNITNPLIDRILVSGAVNQQYLLTLQISSSAALGASIVSLKWDVDDEVLWTNISILIKEHSDLQWQFESGSNFVIAQNTSTTLGLNLSNYASVDDNVTISLTSDTDWSSSWNLGQDTSNNEVIQIQSTSQAQIEFTINVPSVIEGSPLAEFPYAWGIVAISNLDGGRAWYNFSIEVIQHHNLTIDTIEDVFTIDPGSDIRVPIQYRNTGNIESQFHVSVRPVDEFGNVMPFQEQDRFEFSGWEVAIFGQENDYYLAPNESVSIEIGVLSPYSKVGNISFQFEVYSYSATQNVATIRQHVDIVHYRGGDATLTDMNCNNLIPGETCIGQISGINTGNYDDNYTLSLQPVPDWLEITLSDSEVDLPPNQNTPFSTFMVTVKEGVLAYTNGNVTLRFSFADSDSPLVIFTINASVKATMNWSVESKNVIIENNNLTISYLLVNHGNGFDGLSVSMTTSHYGGCGLVPPVDSEWDYESNMIRNFILRDIPNHQNITITMWMEIPSGQTEDGVAWTEIDIQSLGDSEFHWINKTDVDFTGIGTKNETGIINLENLGEDTRFLFNKYGYTLIGILISTIAIYWAIVVRQRRTSGIIKNVNNPESRISTLDWMGKFLPRSKDSVGKKQNSPSIDRSTFMGRFTKNKKSTRIENPEALKGASKVIDDFDQLNSEKELDKISKDLLDDNNEIHSSNQLLEIGENVSTMTKRVDPRGLLSTEDEIVNDIDDDLDL